MGRRLSGMRRLDDSVYGYKCNIGISSTVSLKFRIVGLLVLWTAVQVHIIKMR